MPPAKGAISVVTSQSFTRGLTLGASAPSARRAWLGCARLGVTLRRNLRSSADAAPLREKEPYFRDALVRLSHRRPLNPPDDLTRLDDRLLIANMMTESARIAGPGVVKGVSIVSEAPQHRTGLPIPAPQDRPK